MIPVLTGAQIKTIELHAQENGYGTTYLFDRVAEAVSLRLTQIIGHDRVQAKVTFLVGSGNNGRDALFTALLLRALQPTWQLSLYFAKPLNADDPIFDDLMKAEVFMVMAGDDQQYRVLQNLIATSQVVVDALLGIGVRLPLEGHIAGILQATQQSLRRVSKQSILEVTGNSPIKVEQRPYILAIDLPTGVHADTGEVDRHTLNCDETLVLIAMKQGLVLTQDAQTVSGLISIAPLGLPVHFFKHVQSVPQFLTSGDLQFPPRKQTGHKGSFGKVMIVGGSTNYIGAVGLSAKSAYRMGVGLVTIASSNVVIDALAGILLEPTWIVLPNVMGVIAHTAQPVLMPELHQVDALLVGPGLGQDPQTKAFLESLLEQHSFKPQAEKRGLGFLPHKPTEVAHASREEKQSTAWVMDADALNLLSQIENWHSALPPHTILTPHPGEMARLCGTTIASVQANRFGLTQQKAQEWNCVVLLKGAHTVIGSPDGAIYVLPYKTDALSTAGSGDVLAGMILGLLAQGLDSLNATLCAAYLHGMCGHVASRKLGSTRAVIASDLIEVIGHCYADLGLA